ncbi:MAG: hypothetical protein LC117_01735 [Bacteroidia bacterium]|nr:hypothetical protein [Bacteroidia bacterium]
MKSKQKVETIIRLINDLDAVERDQLTGQLLPLLLLKPETIQQKDQLPAVPHAKIETLREVSLHLKKLNHILGDNTSTLF